MGNHCGPGNPGEPPAPFHCCPADYQSWNTTSFTALIFFMIFLMIAVGLFCCGLCAKLGACWEARQAPPNPSPPPTGPALFPKFHHAVKALITGAALRTHNARLVHAASDIISRLETNYSLLGLLMTRRGAVIGPWRKVAFFLVSVALGQAFTLGQLGILSDYKWHPGACEMYLPTVQFCQQYPSECHPSGNFSHTLVFHLAILFVAQIGTRSTGWATI